MTLTRVGDAAVAGGREAGAGDVTVLATGDSLFKYVKGTSPTAPT